MVKLFVPDQNNVMNDTKRTLMLEKVRSLLNKADSDYGARDCG